MVRGDVGPVLDQQAPERPDGCVEAALFADGHSSPGEGPRGLTEAFAVPDLGDQLFGSLLSGPEPDELADGGGAGNPIDGYSGIALELTERGRGEVSEDPVDPARVESEGTQALLQLSNVIASDHRSSPIQEAVAQAPACLDQRRPGLWTTDPIDPQTSPVLEGLDSRSSTVREGALSVHGTGKAKRLQPSLDISNRSARIAKPEGE